ncbi:hypothetical protein HYH03_001341 [Edaphochlamys debaryana]|uniref:Uncharacterized protein n=1 Tax=Edaphochlamys debaryana TaxID=47281 RepID=A0A835YGL5_9CHLO|nr:hypothetical protein HYH03_001341 [Edaphochlamys debaryana]|eukprot:KAG2500571.1 hypothetical protein HYH03_001341 [Edaphochlamys debaryana]
MGWEYSGEWGMLGGFLFGNLKNMQEGRAWFRRPWLHAAGMVTGYYLMKAASDWEDEALRRIIGRYERKGYAIPEDRKELFTPKSYQ